MLPQQYCLRWRYHHSNLQTMFSQLLEREAFCDVTLACEGRTIKAHKIVLSACSTYFETILSQYEEKDPILIMKDVKYVDIKCLVEFMYKGEINVEHCHLATLLKTAEELRIKGLAEVSWRDEEQPGNSEQGSPNGLQNAMPPVTTVMDSPPPTTKYESPSNRKKRGRPPIDDYDQAFTTPKIMNVHGNVDETYSNDAMSSSEHDLNIWDDDQANEGTDNQDNDEPPMKIKKEMLHDDDIIIDDRSNLSFTGSGSQLKQNVTTSGSQSFLTPQIEKEWPDVVKMNEYLNTGRRQQFWEEPFTKRVMDAIKTKNLEMKVAAELLGVSYGTLYGRYRDSYGCLKHPYRVRDFWTEQGPTDVLLKLKRKEITLFRAAEQLNVTPQTLSNYLISMSQLDNPDTNSMMLSSMAESYDGDSDEEGDSILPDIPSNNTNVFKHLVATTTSSSPAGAGGGSGICSNNTNMFKHLGAPTTPTHTSSAVAAGGGGGGGGGGNSVLANCPDITIIKKEKMDGKVNNNSDHSEINNDK